MREVPGSIPGQALLPSFFQVSYRSYGGVFACSIPHNLQESDWKNREEARMDEGLIFYSFVFELVFSCQALPFAAWHNLRGND